MTKTLKQVLKQDQEPIKIPKSVQDALPIKKVWADGTFLVGNNKYSRTYRFSDINYMVASSRDKEAMFLRFEEVLNSLEVGATTKETVCNRKINMEQFARQNLFPMRGNALDPYREEQNREIMEKAGKGSGILQEKYLTVSVVKNSYQDALAFFHRISAELASRFKAVGSNLSELDLAERLRIFHDFFRIGEEDAFRFDLKELMRKGYSFADTICPDGLSFSSDYIRVGKKYARVLYLQEYPSYLKDTLVSELTELNRNLMLSIDIIPVPTDEAIREVERRLLGTETNITNWQRKQNQNNNFSAVVPYDLKQQQEESKGLLDDLINRNQRMMFAVLTMVHAADSKKQLDTDTDALLAVARKHLCRMEPLRYQQMAGLNTVLPYGLRTVGAVRALTTESTAGLMP